MIKTNLNIILASASPRRQELLKGLDIVFETKIKPINEDFPEHLSPLEIALFLANKKSEQYLTDLQENDLLITADTIVHINGQILNKPKNIEHAKKMLQILSGQMHEVITGVCLRTLHKKHIFYVLTRVYFKPLSLQEIDYYIENYKPLDKAGAYGIQEWIGYIGVQRIDGSFYNVMGLPVKELYEAILAFADK